MVFLLSKLRESAFELIYTKTTPRHFTKISTWTLLVSNSMCHVILNNLFSQLENDELLFIFLIYLNGETNLNFWTQLYTHAWRYQALKQIHYIRGQIHELNPDLFLFAG